MKLVSLTRWRWSQFLRVLPLLLFLGMLGLNLLAERQRSVGQWVGVGLIGLFACWWTLPELRRGQVDPSKAMIDGNRLLEAGKPEEAKAWFEECFRLHPQQPIVQATALHNSAIACLRCGEFDDAKQRFVKVMDSGWPGHWQEQGRLGVMVPNALAFLEALQGNAEEARRLQALALKKVPERGRAAYRVVEVVLDLREGRLKEALLGLERLSSGPSAPQREAVLGVLWGFAMTQQGVELASERIVALQQIPGSRRWMGVHWPEMAAWMRERGFL